MVTVAGNKKKRFLFRFDLGDWSADGHGMHETFTVSAAKGMKAAENAFKEAKKKYPKLNPENFCADYDDNTIPKEVIKEAAELGFKFPDADLEDPYEPDEDKKDEGPGEFMSFCGDNRVIAEYIVWYLNLANPKLDARLVPEKELPWSWDLSTCGYGLFST